MKTGMAFIISVLSTCKSTSTIWDDTETLFTRGPSAHQYPRSAPARHIAVASKGRIPPPSDSLQIERSATISSKSLSATNLVDIAHATKKMQFKSKRPKFNGSDTFLLQVGLRLSQPGFSLEGCLALPIKVGIKVGDLTSKAKRYLISQDSMPWCPTMPSNFHWIYSGFLILRQINIQSFLLLFFSKFVCKT